MTLPELQNTVAKKADTKGTKINVAEVSRVLQVLAEVCAADPAAHGAFMRKVAREEAKQKKGAK